MNLTVNKSEFLKALQTVSKAVNPKPIIPLFSNILLEVEGDNARLSGTNFEIGISANIGITNGGSFTTAIPAKLITDFIGALSPEIIEMKFDKVHQSILIETETSKNSIKCVNADDFPSVPSVENPITVNSTLFKEAIGRVAFAASQNTDRTPLDGVLIEASDNKLIMFATDGFHLSYEELAFGEHELPLPELHAIIRASNLETIARIIDEDKEIFISSPKESNNIRFNIEGLNIVAQKLDGNFPDYRMLEPKTPTTSISISTLTLLRSCKQLELFAGNNGLVKVSIEGMNVELSTTAKEKGESKINLVIIVNGMPITIGVNVFFLHEFLEICKTPDILIDFTGANAPVLLKMKDFDSYYHIIMPIGL